MTKDQSSDKKTSILTDHKRQGKKLVAPIKYHLKDIKFIKWLDNALPEIIWLAMLRDRHNTGRFVKIISKVAEINYAINDSKQSEKQNVINLALINDYSDLTDDQIEFLKQELKKAGYWNDVVDVFNCIVSVYPQCPLNRLVPMLAGEQSAKDELHKMRETLKKYFFRYSNDTNNIEAAALFMSSASGVLKFTNIDLIPNFDNLINLTPGNQEYERTAARIRSQFLTILSMKTNASWPHYFWNRGLELNDCE